MRRAVDNLAGLKLGPFVLDRRIGVGGMGIVYLARDTSLDRLVAVKALHPALAQDDIMIERFQREAKAAARLSHPHIVQIHAVGRQDNISYIAMEYVDGESLEALLLREGPLPWQRAFAILWQVASALDCAHGAGVIHRDIKPPNILIDKQGRARVSDFGVAKVLESQHQLTTDTMFVGTPAYASPEQCGVGKVCPASDLFSLGATAYEMLTRRLPFRAETPAELVRKITMEPFEPLAALLPDVPHPARVIVETLLEKDLNRRYASARELLEELERLRTGQTVTRDAAAQKVQDIEEAVNAATASLDAPRPAPVQRSNLRAIPWRAVGIIALVLVVAGFAVHTLGVLRRDTVAPPPDAPSLAPDTPTPPVGPRATGAGPRERPFAPAEIFNRYDKNRDNRITRDELPPDMQDKVMRADANGDGAVTRQEWEAARQRVQRRANTPQAAP